MREVFNGFLLNEIVNTVLLLVVLVLCWNTAMDRRNLEKKQDQYFFLFVLYFALYFVMMLVCLPAEHFLYDPKLVTGLSILRVLIAVIMYTFACCWVLSIVEETHPVPRGIKLVQRWLAAVMFPIMLLINLTTHSTLFSNIPIFLFYGTEICIILFYHRVLGKRYTTLLTLFTVPTFLLLAQEWWNYTPANIYAVVMLMIIYSQIWERRKAEILLKEKSFAQQQAELANARIMLTTQQINPHFVFNAFSAIAALCDINPTEAKRLTLEFAEYMRGNSAALSSVSPIAFSKELEHTQHYVFIEKTRFGGIFDVTYDLKTTDFSLPPISLQPLVENAIKHGIMPKGGGTVRVESDEDEANVYLRVMDDGIGFDTSELFRDSTGHIGLSNVRQRIELIMGGTLNIVSAEGCGTTATICIPKETLHQQEP